MSTELWVCNCPKLINSQVFRVLRVGKFNFFGQVTAARDLWNKRGTNSWIMDVKRMEVTVIQSDGIKFWLGHDDESGQLRKIRIFTTGLLSTTSRRKNSRPRFFVKTSPAKKCRRRVTFLAATTLRRRFDGTPQIFSEEEDDVAFYGAGFDFLRGLLFSSVY